MHYDGEVQGGPGAGARAPHHRECAGEVPGGPA